MSVSQRHGHGFMANQFLNFLQTPPAHNQLACKRMPEIMKPGILQELRHEIIYMNQLDFSVDGFLFGYREPDTLGRYSLRTPGIVHWPGFWHKSDVIKYRPLPDGRASTTRQKMSPEKEEAED